MKLKGFTLAEILITLTIIGVVAAITLPALRSSTNTAQVGPKLAKFASSFELANQNMLQEKSGDSITGFYNGNTAHLEYSEALTDYLRASVDKKNKNVLRTKDGLKIDISKFNPSTETKPHRRYVTEVAVNINPNTEAQRNVQMARDLFYFALYDDGSLRPKGGQNWDERDDNEPIWSDTNVCENGEAPSDPQFCAGSIFENGFKVMYK